MKIIALITLALCIVGVGNLSYDWSFNPQPALGGWLGFLTPIVLMLAAWVAGVYYQDRDQ